MGGKHSQGRRTQETESRKSRSADRAGQKGAGEDEDFWERSYRIAYIELGLLPDTFFSLTLNELDALYAHHLQEREFSREMAAFTGYCTAAAVAQWLNDGLPPFAEFYKRPEEQQPEQTSEEYIARYDSWT